MTHKQWPKEGPAFNFVRTLIEIIEAAKANEEVGLEDLRYAICAPGRPELHKRNAQIQASTLPQVNLMKQHGLSKQRISQIVQRAQP